MWIICEDPEIRAYKLSIKLLQKVLMCYVPWQRFIIFILALQHIVQYIKTKYLQKNEYSRDIKLSSAIYFFPFIIHAQQLIEHFATISQSQTWYELRDLPLQSKDSYLKKPYPDNLFHLVSTTCYDYRLITDKITMWLEL